MAKTQAICINCKDIFTLNWEEQKLHDDGYLSLDNYLCDDCAIDCNLTQSEFEDYTDDDCGL